MSLQDHHQQLRLPCTQILGNLVVASGKPTSRAVLSSSGDGQYLAVAWPTAHTYAIYMQGAAAWQE